MELTTPRPRRLTPYRARVAAVALALLAATAAVIATAPRPGEITVVKTDPFTFMPTLRSPISVTFSRPVERRSAERAFVLYPPERGSFSWPDDRTLRFTPAAPLRPAFNYRIIVRAGLRDTRGYQNLREVSWVVRTP